MKAHRPRRLRIIAGGRNGDCGEVPSADVNYAIEKNQLGSARKISDGEFLSSRGLVKSQELTLRGVRLIGSIGGNSINQPIIAENQIVDVKAGIYIRTPELLAVLIIGLQRPAAWARWQSCGETLPRAGVRFSATPKKLLFLLHGVADGFSGRI